MPPSLDIEDDQTLWERSTVRAYWRSYVRWELDILWWFRRTEAGRALALPLRHVISMNPTRDISALTWTGVGFGLFYSGYHFTMNCLLNALAVLLLRALIDAKRPAEYDRRLRQLADRSRGNTGLPAIEVHMASAVVVFGQLALVASADRPALAGLFWAAAVFLTGIVALSRLVAGSRFLYQVAASLGTGAAGMATAIHYTMKLGKWKKKWHSVAQNRAHVILLIVVGFVGVACRAARDPGRASGRMLVRRPRISA